MVDIFQSLKLSTRTSQITVRSAWGIILVSILALIVLVGCTDAFPEAATNNSVADEQVQPVEESQPNVSPAEESTTEPKIITEEAAPVITGTSPVTDVEIETSIPTETPGPQAEPGNGESLEQVEFARAEIEDNVVHVRGLEPRSPVVVTLLNRDELRQRIEGELLADYTVEIAQNDAIVMSAFDFFSRDYDLYGFTLDLLTEEIAGYYDPETDEFVLIDEDEEFNVLEKLTHAHEYVHALQDQHFDLEQLDDDSLDSEASMALTALAEGDATMVQTLYLIEGYLSPEELLEALTESLSIETPILDEAPPVLSRQLLFPYLEGSRFVESLYMEGGFEAVDQAWSNPPKSTEHILHPQQYLDDDMPQIVSLAPFTSTLGIGWQMIDQDSLGELYLREYLAQQLDDQVVDIAATGWGGDQYAVYWNEADEDFVLIMRFAWDSPADGEEFSSAYQGYPSGLFDTKSRKQPDGGICWEADDVICLYSIEGETIISRAPDLATAAQVASEQIEFMRAEDA